MTCDDSAWVEAVTKNRALSFWWRWAVQPGGPGGGVDRGALWVYLLAMRMHRLAWRIRTEN